MVSVLHALDEPFKPILTGTTTPFFLLTNNCFNATGIGYIAFWWQRSSDRSR